MVRVIDHDYEARTKKVSDFEAETKHLEIKCSFTTALLVRLRCAECLKSPCNIVIYRKYIFIW